MEIRRADQIANTLEQLVFAGEFRDGERLDEVKLAEQFHVSRTPIREALQVLVASGMAEQIPRRGVFIRQPGPVELMEMFEAMAEIEAACGRLAASRMSDQDLDLLAAANEGCQQASQNSDRDLYYSENETFHQLIYRGASNSYLEKQALQLQNRLKAYRKIQLQLRGRLTQSMNEHSEILRFLREGDADNTAKALRDHVAIQGEKFHQLMASFDR
ncbi:GntR family transcriptional regulator [Phaeobacter inhibens]|uniref:GntR family transcriptional regulator n=1 Tax=Phaeobacter inhibens TaxID=221822 RepID=UPI0027553A44|nr:GntR family transcriptional regulator [Phaeobacter inhibens]GLO68670.1 GntR family transcriptional regulator [Phaeobacter inhibens]